MAGTIIQVWFERSADVPGAAERMQFYIIETEMPDFASVCEMLDADRLIGGAVLRTQRVSNGVQEITGRRPIAFRGCAVARCELPRFSYVEGAGA